jgi:tetratricopeptide (TPR) repeat protein
MIDVFEALSWLNEFDGSHLTPAAQILLTMSRDVSQTDEQIQTMLRNLRALAQATRDPLEATEITLHRAVLQFWRGAFPQSIRLARRACRGFGDDPHREAIARWILGMAQWNVSENDMAYANWDNARIFMRASVNNLRIPLSSRNWYEEQHMRMEIDLAFKPEEILHWLNEFEPTHLTLPSQQLVDVIHERIRQRSYPDANALMRDLQEVNRWSRELYERAEVYLECAFFSYQMGNIQAAIELLRRAIVDFFPGAGTNHKHVVARCMLGTIEWMDQSTLINAVGDWRTSIIQLEELRLQADRMNDQGRKNWYANHRTIIRRALLERLPNAGQSRRNLRPTQPTSP